MENKKTIIAESLLFSELPEEQLDKVAAIAVARTYERGEQIFFDGDEGNGFYMVVAGQVKIYKMSLDGKEHILHIFGPGEPIGEVPVFHGKPFPANAMALVKSRLLFFPRQQFVDLVAANPSLALNILAMLSLRLRRFAAKIESLSLKEVPGRLADYLLYLAEEQGSTARVTLDIPKGQLASLLGTIPETLSRIFARMTDEGLIRVDGRTIYLEDLEGLRDKK
ncbi:MAG TPA: Crp/Fnr family transcriptional regulator [Desulfobacteraceae bacterium]|nr:Crp/Fnr family transcriptional regulator [Desulfobacteraceae bacterium]